MLEAATGEAGIYQASMNHPDLIVLDLGLPDITGIEVLRRIRDWSRIPIIVLTAKDREADKIEALDGGADDYVTKPFGMGELVARIRVALRHSGNAPAGDRCCASGGSSSILRSGSWSSTAAA